MIESIKVKYNENVGEWLRLRHLLPRDWFDRWLQFRESSPVIRPDESPSSSAPAFAEPLHLVSLGYRLTKTRDFQFPQAKADVKRTKTEISEIQKRIDECYRNEANSKKTYEGLLTSLRIDEEIDAFLSADPMQCIHESVHSISSGHLVEILRLSNTLVNDLIPYYKGFCKSIDAFMENSEKMDGMNQFQRLAHVSSEFSNFSHGVTEICKAQRLELLNESFRKELTQEVSELFGFVQARLEADFDREALKLAEVKIPVRSKDTLATDKKHIERIAKLLNNEESVWIYRLDQSQEALDEVVAQLRTARSDEIASVALRHDLGHSLSTTKELLNARKEELDRMKELIGSLRTNLTDEMSRLANRQIVIVGGEPD